MNHVTGIANMIETVEGAKTKEDIARIPVDWQHWYFENIKQKGYA
jgi:hypothetical protein